MRLGDQDGAPEADERSNRRRVRRALPGKPGSRDRRERDEAPSCKDLNGEPVSASPHVVERVEKVRRQENDGRNREPVAPDARWPMLPEPPISRKKLIHTALYRYGSVCIELKQAAASAGPPNAIDEMAAPIRTPRSSWIEEGLRALGVGGPDAIRVEKLARALGVTKGGFYWHFDGRPALLEEMLDAWERLAVDEVIKRVEAEGGDARTKLRHLFTVATSSPDLLKVELAIRQWGERDTAVARRLKRVDNRRMEYMRSLFGVFCPDEEEVEVRCLVAFSLFIGNDFIAADHGPRSRAAVLALALKRLEA
jgi:AcrR family transcriptional regulator